MYQGPRKEAQRLNQWLPDGAAKVDAVILSHGHLDHCGKLPVLTRAGFAGPIYCTPATAEVARIVLEDAADIQEEDIDYLNQRSRAPGEEPLRPLYTARDIPRLLGQFRRTPLEQAVDLGKNVSFIFYDAGHILGSAYVVLNWQEEGRPARSLLFTADVGRYDTPILRDPRTVPGAVDYVITESTYGGRKHEPMSQVGPQLLDAVKFCIERRSRLLLPAFAVGRTQTILWYIERFIQEKQIPRIPMYLDSPMGVEVSRAHDLFHDQFDEETLKAFGDSALFCGQGMLCATSRDESKRINADPGPCVIIASSPSCEFGRILHHLRYSVERPNDMIVFTGWIPDGTLGRRLQNGEKRARIYDQYYDVKCHIRTIHGLSAHADGDELIRFLRPTIRGQTQFYVVHGEAEEAETFAKRLVSEGAGRAEVPAMESSVVAV